MTEAVRAALEHEDGVRGALKARLQQLGDVVNISVKACSIDPEDARQPRLAEDCRTVSSEAADLGRQISRRMGELKAEVESARRSRLMYTCSRQLPTASAHEIEILREEVKSLKLREHQLVSQVEMVTAAAAHGGEAAAPGEGLDELVAAEVTRLNEEVSTLRIERETWRARALAAEARLALDLSASSAAAGSDVHSAATYAHGALPAQSGAGGGTTEGERSVGDERGGLGIGDSDGVEWRRGWGDEGRRRCGSAEAGALEPAVPPDGRGPLFESDRDVIDGDGEVGARRVQDEVQTNGSGRMSINVQLSLPYAQVRDRARERSSLKHTLILDLLVALKDAGHTLRPALLQVLISCAGRPGASRLD